MSEGSGNGGWIAVIALPLGLITAAMATGILNGSDCPRGAECVSRTKADAAVQQGLSMKRAIAQGCDIPAPVWNADDRTQWDQSFANAQTCFHNIANGLPVNEGVSPGGALAGDQTPSQEGQDLDYDSEPINFEPPQ